ncbi:MAG: undecaprenyldiphospho-muramoylpentapeptide beta-N-acetylglucosaminyltransferase [Mariprofundaceae bacterium]|nr:undecaprenyldiphospho-muramoylpentapeptide beta-N-acetylglucosaminyltransferase [Mariprofundaceae bacterium]
MIARKRLSIAGGGTGGHVMPALALADAVRTRWGHVDVDFIGAQRGLEATLLPARGEHVQLLPMHAIQGKAFFSRLHVLGFEVPRAVISILRAWRGNKPDLLVGVGGYASVHGVLAAFVAGVPVVLYEQNAMPGMVNRQLARWCKTIMLGFANAAQYLPRAPCVVTGNIVRESIVSLVRTPHIPPRLLIMGGSQGAVFLNETMPVLCAKLRAHGRVFQVIHICGQQQDPAALLAAYESAQVDATVMAFCDDMATFYRQGDLLIARAGAMTVSEVMACALPSIFVPLPSAADQHQYHNAAPLVSAGGALLWQQQDNDHKAWAQKLEQVLFNPLTLINMRHSMRAAMPDDACKEQLTVLSPWLEHSL